MTKPKTRPRVKMQKYSVQAEIHLPAETIEATPVQTKSGDPVAPTLLVQKATRKFRPSCQYRPSVQHQ